LLSGAICNEKGTEERVLRHEREVSHCRRLYDVVHVIFFFVIALILWNNSALTNLRSLLHAEFHVLRGPRPQDAGTHSLLLLHFVLYILLYNAIAVLVTCPRMQDYRNNLFSARITGLAGDRTRASCVALSCTNRSSIHYDCT
jgi:hypothetical protein